MAAVQQFVSNTSLNTNMAGPSPKLLPTEQLKDNCSVYGEDDGDMASPTSSNDVHETSVPDLPVKSSRRVTQLLSNLPHKLQQQPALSQAAPHDHYLSSEEDASSSADELSDYSFDSDDELSPTTSHEAYQQVTARAISVVYSGKPSIINLPRRSCSPLSIESRSSNPSTDFVAPNPSFAKRMSIMSFSSAALAMTRPNSVMIDGGEKIRPDFLDSDPFPSAKQTAVPRMQAKTPGTMLKKTLNLVKRRSRTHLNQAAALSRDSLVLGRELSEESRTQTQQSPESSPSKFRLHMARGIRT